MNVKQYRKKPVVIEAILLDESIIPDEAADWCGGYKNWNGGCQPITITIPTLEGDMIVSKDDYIIKGVNGEFYPCKPDIFEKTYEEISNE